MIRLAKRVTGSHLTAAEARSTIAIQMYSIVVHERGGLFYRAACRAVCAPVYRAPRGIHHVFVCYTVCQCLEAEIEEDY